MLSQPKAAATASCDRLQCVPTAAAPGLGCPRAGWDREGAEQDTGARSSRCPASCWPRRPCSPSRETPAG